MSPSSLPDVSADRLNGNGNEDAFSQFLREAEEAMANDLHELADELCSVLSASYHSKLSEVYQEHRRVCHKLEDESNSSLGSEIAATQAERQRQVTEGSSASLVSGHSRSRQVSNLSAASKQVSNMSNMSRVSKQFSRQFSNGNEAGHLDGVLEEQIDLSDLAVETREDGNLSDKGPATSQSMTPSSYILAFVKSDFVAGFFAFAIVFSIALVGVETQFATRRDLSASFLALDATITFIFVLEFAFRFIALGWALLLPVGKNMGNCVDGVLVLMCIGLDWIEPIIMVACNIDSQARETDTYHQSHVDIQRRSEVTIRAGGIDAYAILDRCRNLFHRLRVCNHRSCDDQQRATEPVRLLFEHRRCQR